MKKIIIPLGIIVIILLVIGTYFFKSQTKIRKITPVFKQTISSPTKKDNHYLAGFAIFTNGTFRIFTAPMYHNRSTDVYIQKDNPNVVHVKKEKVRWEDFFATLPMMLTGNCLITGTKETFCTTEKTKLQFYLNEEYTPDLLDKEIKDGDRALITYGSQSAEKIKEEYEKVPNPKKK